MKSNSSSSPTVTKRFGFLVLGLAAFLVAAPLWFPGQTIAEDDALLYFPFLYRPFWDALWNPIVSGGVPQLANPQTGFFYPPAWLLGMDYFRGLAPYLSLHFFAAGAGLFLFARTHLGRGLGPLLAGLVYGCGGAAFSLATKLDKLPGYAFLPWVLLGLTWILGRGDARERGFGWLLSAGGVALIAFGGSIEGLPTVFLAAFAWFFVLQGRESLGRRFLLVMAPLCLGVILASVLLVPFAHYLPESNRGGALSASAALSRSLHPFEWVSFVWPGAFYSETHHSVLLEDGLPKLRFLYGRYGGAFFSLLVLLGVGSVFSNRGKSGNENQGPSNHHMTLRAMVVAGLFLFLALGAYNPVYVWMQAHLPVFSSMRFPEKWWLGGLPFVCFLGAIGFQVLWESGVRSLVMGLCGLGAVALVGVLAVVTMGSEGGLSILGGAVARGGVFLALSLALFYALRQSRLKPILGVGLLCLTVMVDLAAADARTFWIFQVDEAFAPSAAMLAIQQDWGDKKGIPFVWDDTAHRGIPLPPAAQGLDAVRLAHNLAYENTGLNHGLAYICGSLALRPERQENMLHIAMKMNPKMRRSVLRNAGIVYWLLWDMQEGMKWVKERGFRPVPAAPGTSLPIPVLAERSPLAPIRWASEGRVAEDGQGALDLIARGLKPQTLVLAMGDPGLRAFENINLAAIKPNTLSYEQERGNRWRVDYDSREDGALILAQSWAPGWQYKIDDGAFEEAARVNYALVGAPAPKGTHTLMLRYRPAGLGLGIVMSLLTLLLILGVAKTPPSLGLTQGEQPS